MTSKLATLEEQVKEMQAEIERLKQEEQEQESLPDILWKPEDGKQCFALNAEEPLRYKAFSPFPSTNRIYKVQQLFKTREEAEKADRQRIALMKVLRRVAELNHEQGWVCDWDSGSSQYKYFPYFQHSSKKTLLDWFSYVQHYPTSHYAAEGVWETVISEMEGDVKFGLWGIE